MKEFTDQNANELNDLIGGLEEENAKEEEEKREKSNLLLKS